jgi:excisionase family DNA binding protein
MKNKRDGNNKELTVRETAARLGIGLQFVYVMLWDKRLTGRKEGSRWFISEASVVAREKRKENRLWQPATK